MQFVNIHQAKTHLSKYLEQVEREQSTIVLCRNGRPVAQLVRYAPVRKKKKLGLLRGKIKIHQDFDELPSEFMSHFQ